MSVGLWPGSSQSLRLPESRRKNGAQPLPFLQWYRQFPNSVEPFSDRWVPPPVTSKHSSRSLSRLRDERSVQTAWSWSLEVKGPGEPLSKRRSDPTLLRAARWTSTWILHATLVSTRY